MELPSQRGSEGGPSQWGQEEGGPSGGAGAELGWGPGRGRERRLGPRVVALSFLLSQGSGRWAVSGPGDGNTDCPAVPLCGSRGWGLKKCEVGTRRKGHLQKVGFFQERFYEGTVPLIHRKGVFFNFAVFVYICIQLVLSTLYALK